MASPAPSTERIIEVLDKITLDESKLPTEIRGKVNLEEIKQVLANSKSVNILVTGKTGTGKSTLVNGLIGRPVAKVGDEIDKPQSCEITEYCETYDGIKVTVWDSPGLQDGTDNDEAYLANMAEKCKELDLVLYCVSMIETRFLSGNQDAIAMEKLTKCFGTDFWKHVVVALTFANGVDAIHLPLQHATTPDKKRKIFQDKLDEWKNAISKTLVDDVHVPPDIVMEICFIPAGHHRIPYLHDRDYWLSTLWFECARKISRPEGRGSLVILSYSRLRDRKQVKDDDFKKPIHEQPIVFTEEITEKTKILGGIIITIIGGAAVGTTAGTLLGGTLGMGLGAGIGAPVGLVVGLIGGAIAAYKMKIPI